MHATLQQRFALSLMINFTKLSIGVVEIRKLINISSNISFFC